MNTILISRKHKKTDVNVFVMIYHNKYRAKYCYEVWIKDDLDKICHKISDDFYYVTDCKRQALKELDNINKTN